jgi:hypothetical protein
MKTFICIVFPLWTLAVALCFGAFALGWTEFGFQDHNYGTLGGWIAFAVATFANAVLAFAMRAAYAFLKFATWVLLLAAILFLLLYRTHLDIATQVAATANFIVAGISLMELGRTLKFVIHHRADLKP